MSAHTDFHAEEGTWVMCHDYGERRPPILALSGEHVYLTITGAADLGPADHLAFARDLAAKTAAYVEALERYATGRTDTAKTG